MEKIIRAILRHIKLVYIYICATYRNNNNFYFLFFLGISTCACYIPSIYLILSLYRWFCMVCTFTREKILYETILPICLDTCRVTYCRDTKLPYHPEYIRRIDMVCILPIKIIIIIPCMYLFY